MADIELVIKIPRKVYKAICDKNALGCDISDIKNIIRNGTPLPKGHGRLIDADAVFDKMQSTFDMQDLYLPIHLKELIVDEMPTIIEADKE